VKNAVSTPTHSLVVCWSLVRAGVGHVESVLCSAGADTKYCTDVSTQQHTKNDNQKIVKPERLLVYHPKQQFCLTLYSH